MITISIIIPVFNRSKLLLRAVNSVLNQTELPNEIIIIDDGSTDETPKVGSGLALQFSLIKFIPLPQNMGAQHARNVGIQRANGDFILLMDSDNELRKDYLIKEMNLLKNSPKTDVLTCFSRVINEIENKEESFSWNTKGNVLFDLLNGKSYMDFNSALIRKEKLLQIGYLDEKCPSFQEWDTAIRLAGICNFDYIPEELAIYYKHRQNRISNDIRRELEGRYYVVHKHKTLWLKTAGKEAYMKYLHVNYKIADDHQIMDLKEIAKEELLSIDSLYFLKICYRRFNGWLRNKLAGGYRKLLKLNPEKSS